MTKLMLFIEKVTTITPEFQAKIFLSFIIIFILWVLYILVLKLLNKQVKKIRTVYYWRKIINYSTFILGIFLVGRIWFNGFQSIATYLGLLTAGLTIALKDLITNIAGWIFIIWRKPFHVGDRIQIGDSAGDVIDLEIFMFTILEIGNWVDAEQSSGRMIQIPNNTIFITPLANYTKGFKYIWNEIPVLITFESDWKKAKDLLTEIITKLTRNITPAMQSQIREASKKFMIFYDKLTPIVYTSVRENGVLLTIRYLCNPHERRGTEQEIWEDILKEFGKSEDIDFAYPTQRFFNNATEGKTK